MSAIIAQRNLYTFRFCSPSIGAPSVLKSSPGTIIEIAYVGDNVDSAMVSMCCSSVEPQKPNLLLGGQISDVGQRDLGPLELGPVGVSPGGLDTCCMGTCKYVEQNIGKASFEVKEDRAGASSSRS